MISNKFIALTLCALTVVSAAFSAGCTTDDPASTDFGQTLHMSSTMYDVDGSALANASFDYSISIVNFGGKQAGYFIAGQTTDENGQWAKTERDLTFVDADGSRCANECVQWDQNGCSVYAMDCWSADYSDTLTVYTIDGTQMTSSAGFQTTNGGYRVYQGIDAGSFMTDSPRAFMQMSDVATDLTASVAGIELSGRTNTSAHSSVVFNLARSGGKPYIITDLTQLSKAQKDKLMFYREVSKLDDSAFRVSATVVGSAAK
jgi:hypothetical protein